MNAEELQAKVKKLVDQPIVKGAAGILEMTAGNFVKNASGLFVPVDGYAFHGTQDFAAMFQQKPMESDQSFHLGFSITEELLNDQIKKEPLYPGKVFFSDAPIQGAHYDGIIVDDIVEPPIYGKGGLIEEFLELKAQLDALIENKTGVSDVKTATQTLADIQAMKDKNMAIVKGAFSSLLVPGLANSFHGTRSRRYTEKRVQVLEAIVAAMLLTAKDNKYTIDSETLAEAQRVFDVRVTYVPESDEFHATLE